MAHTYRVICNRTEGEYAVCDDLENASHIVAALMQTRPAGSEGWYEYWVRDDAGNEYSYDASYNTCFIDRLPEQVAS